MRLPAAFEVIEDIPVNYDLEPIGTRGEAPAAPPNVARTTVNAARPPTTRVERFMKRPLQGEIRTQRGHRRPWVRPRPQPQEITT